MSDVSSLECPFCRIVAGGKTAHVVYETEEAIAFLDENPAVEGHVLIVPKDHVPDIVTAEPSAAGAVFEVLGVAANALDTVLDVAGFSVFHTSGPLVGTVEHAHVHLLPRTRNDGVSLSLTRSELDDDEGSAFAERLREAV